MPNNQRKVRNKFSWIKQNLLCSDKCNQSNWGNCRWSINVVVDRNAMQCDAIQRNANAKKNWNSKCDLRWLAGAHVRPCLHRFRAKIWFKHNDIQPCVTDVKSALSFIFLVTPVGGAEQKMAIFQSDFFLGFCVVCWSLAPTQLIPTSFFEKVTCRRPVVTLQKLMEISHKG